ncbi:MAG: gliding motility-associated C-terminal domain-containing protein, partial [Spirochaetales bacterium]|nr:gliding motility-associated C-terminal domain-containing protein [Spirochaetales bacterium]
LSRGIGNGGTIMPSGIAINPAGNAFAQRLKFEFGYGVAPGLWSEYSAGQYADPSDDMNVYNRHGSFQNGADFFMPSYGNFGFLISTKYGNFTGYSTYMNFGNDPWGANNNDIGAGKIGTIYFGFSKDYNDHFAFGVSGNVKIAYNEHSKYADNKFDVGGGFDFGFIFRPGWVTYFNKKKAPHWGFQDWEFSIALKEIGKPLINMPDGVDVVDGYDDLTWFGDPFTINGGISFNIFNDGATYWKWLFDVGTPFFQNFKTSIGTEVQIYKFLVLRTAYTFDLEGVLEYAGVIPLYEYMYNLANVNFGLSLRFTSDFFKKQSKEEAYANRHKRTEFSVDFGGKPYHDGFLFQLGCSITIGAKDETPPEISYIAKDYYISPNLDGVQDNLNVDITINDDRYVMYWKFEIYDRDGKTVRTIESKEQRAETMKFTDVVKKYFKPKQGVPVPKTLIWDGRDNAGQVVEDGTYTYKFFAMDDNNNMDPKGSASGQIVIKTDKPLIEHKTQNVIFSPNNDGQKDSLIIDLDIIRDNVEPQFIPLEEMNIGELDIQPVEIQTVNAQVKDQTADVNEKKQLWYVDILDNGGNVVKTFELDQKGKVRLEWDGKNDAGDLMPDGVYKVKLHSVDLAGNYWEDFITNIIINTEATPIELKLHDKIFSPNGDGKKDTVGWTLNIPNKNGIEKWSFAVRNNQDQPVWTTSGEGLPPKEIVWDGKTDGGSVAAEGHYIGYLLVDYINGNTPSSTSPSFELDIQNPTGNVKFSLAKFSPDGDGNKDTVDIEQSTSYEDQWIGQIADESGKVVKTYMWKGQPPKKFTWDGIDDNNNLLTDGKYYYSLKCEDLAGNGFETSPSAVEIFTKETPVFITALQSYFSPGTKSPIKEEVLSIRDSTSADNKVSEWKLDIKDDKDTLVYTKSGKDSLPNEYKWNGTDSNGKIVLDGAYKATLNVQFESGTSSKSTTTFFNVDTVAPNVEIKALTVDINGKPLFSPNNDGYMDTMEIGQVGSKEDLWECTVYNAAGNAVWNAFSVDSTPKDNLIWDGNDTNNNMCPNGMYRYVITATDKAGNSCTETIDSIELKNVRTTIFVTVDKNAFASELGSTDDNKVILTPMLNVKDDLLAYKMEIKDNANNVVRTFTGDKTVPETIKWDGHNQNGEVLPDGEYGASMAGIYRFGNRPTMDSERFVLDNTPPEIGVT